MVTNADLARTLDTSDEWIVTRTGIRERRRRRTGRDHLHHGWGGGATVDGGQGARARRIDALIVATVTPDMLFPATACLIQDQLGLANTWGFDLSAACSGFLYALTTGAQFVRRGSAPTRDRGRAPTR